MATRFDVYIGDDAVVSGIDLAAVKARAYTVKTALEPGDDVIKGVDLARYPLLPGLEFGRLQGAPVIRRHQFVQGQMRTESFFVGLFTQAEQLGDGARLLAGDRQHAADRVALGSQRRASTSPFRPLCREIGDIALHRQRFKRGEPLTGLHAITFADMQRCHPPRVTDADRDLIAGHHPGRG
ncbi:hypothetical protein BA899_06190 [Spiribacter sp. SSL99]|nr:hypothetical protein BA899_06190 [Spiribacter sp. SSL99]